MKKKLKEYGKKKKKDTGLEFLEYGSESDSEDEVNQANQELDPVPDPRLKDEYILLKLLTPLSSYTDYVH